MLNRLSPSQLQRHVQSTYFTLRIGIAGVSLIFPVLLYVLGRSAGIPLQDSMSAYYAGGTEWTRNVFVGVLFTIGTFLYLYKGFTPAENIALNLAGVLAPVVALFPCRCGDESASWSPHGAAAVGFFAAIAFVCVRCAPDTLGLIRDADTRARYRLTYRILAVIMLGAPAVVFVLALPHWVLSAGIARMQGLALAYGARFVMECLGIWTFAAYWLVKSLELRRTDAESLGLREQIMATPAGVVPIAGAAAASVMPGARASGPYRLHSGATH